MRRRQKACAVWLVSKLRDYLAITPHFFALCFCAVYFLSALFSHCLIKPRVYLPLGPERRHLPPLSGRAWQHFSQAARPVFLTPCWRSRSRPGHYLWILTRLYRDTYVVTYSARMEKASNVIRKPYCMFHTNAIRPCGSSCCVSTVFNCTYSRRC